MAGSRSAAIAAGTKVEVRTRYLENWVTGFEVASIEGDGVRLRRRSDGVVLPATVPREDVRCTESAADASPLPDAVR